MPFRTTQDAEFGLDGAAACSDWLIRYKFALDEGFWQIYRTALEGGPQQPCPDYTPPPSEPAVGGTTTAP